MFGIAAHVNISKKARDHFMFSLPHQPKLTQRETINIAPEYIEEPRMEKGNVSVESSRKYRDTAVWRLLCLESTVDVDNLASYWEIMDAMMDLSVESAITMLQHLYEYRVRKLRPSEKCAEYPGISNDLYRLEYFDDSGVVYRDVCAGTLLQEAIDLLQAEAERLIRL